MVKRLKHLPKTPRPVITPALLIKRHRREAKRERDAAALLALFNDPRLPSVLQETILLDYLDVATIKTLVLCGAAIHRRGHSCHALYTTLERLFEVRVRRTYVQTIPFAGAIRCIPYNPLSRRRLLLGGSWAMTAIHLRGRETMMCFRCRKSEHHESYLRLFGIYRVCRQCRRVFFLPTQPWLDPKIGLCLPACISDRLEHYVGDLQRLLGIRDVAVFQRTMGTMEDTHRHLLKLWKRVRVDEPNARTVTPRTLRALVVYLLSRDASVVRVFQDWIDGVDGRFLHEIYRSNKMSVDLSPLVMDHFISNHPDQHEKVVMWLEIKLEVWTEEFARWPRASDVPRLTEEADDASRPFWTNLATELGKIKTHKKIHGVLPFHTFY